MNLPSLVNESPGRTDTEHIQLGENCAMADQNQALCQAIARNAGLVLSLPSAGMLRHHKSRFLAESEAGFVVESAPGEHALVCELIDSQQMVGVAFKQGPTKVVFTTCILEELPQYQINPETMVEALVLKKPDSVKVIQRRASYRVRITGESEMQLRVWRIGEKSYLRDRPMAAQELAVELRDLSIGGVGVLIKGKEGEPPRISEADRLRIQLTYQSHNLLLEGRLRSSLATPHKDRIRGGIQFKQLQEDLEGRQTQAALTRIVGELQRDEARRVRMGLATAV